MAFPVAPLLDDFLRADEDPLNGNGTWANLDTNNPDTLTLSANGVIITPNAAVTAGAYWVPQNALENCEVYTTINSVAIGASISIFARIQEPGGAGTYDGYFAQVGFSTNYVLLGKMTNGTPSTLFLQITAVSAGDSVLLRCIGPLLELYLFHSNIWTKRLTAIDSTYTRGYLGMAITATATASPKLANFGGGTLALSGDNPSIGVHGRGVSW